ALADIPETEGLFAGGTYNFLKLASSAGHIAGRTFISSESFITIGLDTQALTLEDLYLLAGRAYSAGINRIIYHGYPYFYTLENGSRWYPFPARAEREDDTVSAGPFAFTTWLDEDQALWAELPVFNRQMARLSYAMSLGTHLADVAWLDCDWRIPDKTIMNLDGIIPEQGQSDISLALKQAGLVYDRVSPGVLTNASLIDNGFIVGSAQYDCLLLANFSAASPELLSSIDSLADAGIPVLVMGGLPGRAPGFADYERRDAATQSIAERLQSKVIVVDGFNALGTALLQTAGLQPSLAPSSGEAMAFALDHREISNGHILYLFNEADEDRTQALDVNLPFRFVRIFDPETGDLIMEATPDTSGCLSLEMTIPARRSLVLILER
ncbi:MAG: glycosyl hydrolase, partial [Dehalococcoidia bacterium]